MPRDGSGVYTLPPGTTAVTDTTIESTKYNGFIGDIATDLNAARPIIAGGTGGQTVAQARANLQAERSEQQVLNYDSHAWETGSFWSASGATSAPNATENFTGIVTRVADGAADKWTVVARSRTNTITYVRQKIGGVWGAWAEEGAVRSSDLTITKSPYPTFLLNVSPSPGAGIIGGQKDGKHRWQILMPDPDVESTGNAGSNFTLRRFDDAANMIDDCFKVMRASGSVGIGTTAPNITAQAAGSRVLTVNGPTARSMIELASDQPDGANVVGQLSFVANSNPAGAGNKQIAAILGNSTGSTAGNRGGVLSFWTKPDGAPLASARMDINQNGNVNIGGPALSVYRLEVNHPDVAFGGMRVNGGSTTTELRLDSPRAGASNFGWRLNGAALGDMVLFQSTAPGGDPYTAGRMLMGFSISGATTFYQNCNFNGIIGAGAVNLSSALGINYSDPTINLIKAADANVVQTIAYSGAAAKWMVRWADANNNDYVLYRGPSWNDAPFRASYASGEIYLGSNATWKAVVLATGVFQCRAHLCKAGSEAGYGTNNFNIDSNGATAQIWVNGSNLGTISVTCDYRIKKDVADLDSMWEKVRALRPVSYTQAEYDPPPSETVIEPVKVTTPNGEVVTHTSEPLVVPGPMVKADNIERWGFIAHEVQQTLLPTAATGVKDSRDHIQALNTAPIIAALTKALQEAMTRIEALEAKLATP
jgi:hypothetical protein